MPNHFHFLVREIRPEGISTFLKKLSTGYSMYFNIKHERVGPLFQGRFKAQHVDSDEYLKYLYAYIHLNPVKLIDSRWKEEGIKNRARAKQYLNQYRHSSYLDYCGINREEAEILSVDEFPAYFRKGHSFIDLINDWLNYSAEE